MKLDVALSSDSENGKIFYGSSESVPFWCDVKTNQPLTEFSIAIDGNNIQSNSSVLSIIEPDLARPATMYSTGGPLVTNSLWFKHNF